jgi:hypothetical protein
MQAQYPKSEETGSKVLPPQLRNQNYPEEVPSDGETLRVTPEEVALAAAALEAKRAAEEAWRETTLPLEEAIDHLGLNATAKDLAPEVVSLRVERSRQATKSHQEQRNRRIGNAAGMGLGLAALAVMAGSLWSAHVRPASHNAPSTLKMLPIQKLAVVPDNVPVHIDADTLLKLAKGDVKLEEVSVDTRGENGEGSQPATMFNNEWTLVKANGVVLVKGWATAEFALNISNDSSGALFSARPGWIPANNLVPIEVPVYRLEMENAQYQRYLSNGDVTDNAALSVLMAVNVTDTLRAAKDLVQRDVLASNSTFNTYRVGEKDYIDVDVTKGVVHLTGRTLTAPLRKLAGEVAARTLERLHLPYTISNELDVGPND